ncbi:MAG: MFS transporter [Candidatus Eremiobacteraeota bacterium]|nr:MFS transporter [Candidatus Eremiobacteraeota bacterium]
MVARILPILGITFIDILGFSILIPILPYFVQHFGASDLTVGLLFSTFAACQFIAGPVWGNVSDRIGRKRVLIISQIGATIGWTMLAYAGSLAVVFIARIIEGLSGGNISVTQAYVADLVEPKDRARAFGYVGASFSAGIIFGPLLGGFLLAHYGFSAPFLAAAAIQFITLLLTIFMLPESTSSAERSHVATFADILRSLSDRTLAPLLIQIWAFSLSLYAWFGVLTLLFKEALHFNGSQTSYFFASFGLVSVILQVGIVGGTNDRFGARRTALLGIGSLLVGFLLVPLIHTIWSALPTILLFAFGMAIARPSLTALLTDRTPENQRGTILGVSSALDNLSGVFMPPVSTGVLGAFGPAWAGVPSAFWSVVALVLGLRNRTSNAPADDALPPQAQESV